MTRASARLRAAGAATASQPSLAETEPAAAARDGDAARPTKRPRTTAASKAGDVDAGASPRRDGPAAAARRPGATSESERKRKSKSKSKSEAATQGGRRRPSAANESADGAAAAPGERASAARGKAGARSRQRDSVAGEDSDGDGDGERRYFLMKAEPEPRMERGHDVSFSIDSLAALSPAAEPWDGVRNAEACKLMRFAMRAGDRAFFYHSNCPNPGIAGVMTIAREGYVDESAFDKAHPYYDAKSVRDRPRWYRVDVVYERHLRRFIGLKELRGYQEGELKDMALLRRPQLSVQRVSEAEWDFVMRLEQQAAP